MSTGKFYLYIKVDYIRQNATHNQETNLLFVLKFDFLVQKGSDEEKKTDNVFVTFVYMNTFFIVYSQYLKYNLYYRELTNPNNKRVDHSLVKSTLIEPYNERIVQLFPGMVQDEMSICIFFCQLHEIIRVGCLSSFNRFLV